jgi:cyanate lyase
MSKRTFKSFAQHAAYLTEQATVDLTEGVVAAMRERGLRRVDVADRLGHTKSYVTQLLAGPNMTLATAAALALAVGCQMRVVLEPIDHPPATGKGEGG